MARIAYDPESTMLAARAQYFQANAFGEDGGYNDKWVTFKIGPIPFTIPNTAGRVRAVTYHDLHHVLTGYDTDAIGEFEISAWEIAAGCKDFYAAWFLNLGGLSAGLLSAPRRTFRAFVRGRNSQTLYGADYDGLLTQTVQRLRARTVDDAEGASASPLDVALFAGAAAMGLLAGILVTAVGALSAPFVLAIQAVTTRRATS